MKNLILLPLLLAFLLTLSFCSDDIDYYSSIIETPIVGIDDNELELTGNSEVSKIFIESNFWWKASVEYPSEANEMWIELDSTQGYGNIEINVTTTRNYSLSNDRSATIVIKSNDGEPEFRKEFVIVQKFSSPYIEVAEVEDNGNYSIPLIKSNNILELMTNDEWTAESDQEWVRVTSEGDNGKNNFSLNYDFNDTGEPRLATITISAVNAKNVTYSFLVTQSGVFDKAIPTIEKTPTSFKANWEDVVGAQNYFIDVYDINDQLVGSIDAGVETEWDLASDPIFSTPIHAGYTKLVVRSVSENISIYSESDQVETNSHFTSGKGTESEPYVIGEMESLINITAANKVAVNQGAYYKLGFTPVLDNDFVPLCTPTEGFKGIFDGNGTTISNWSRVVYPDERNYSSLFGGVDSQGKVGNIKFNNCNIKIELSPAAGAVSKTNNGFSFVAAVNSGEIFNITTTNCNISTEAGASPIIVGSIVGINNGSIVDCKTIGGILSAAPDRNKSDEFECGGIAGNSYGLIDRCFNDKTEVIGMTYVGGVAGKSNGSTISNSGTNAKVTGNYYFGGVVGYTDGDASTFINSFFSGTLVMEEPEGQARGAAYMGGIVGRMYRDNDNIENCFVSGDIIVGVSSSSSNIRVGGLTGQVYRDGNVIRNSYFSGTIQVAGKADLGGIAALIHQRNSLIENCYSVGEIIRIEGSSGNIYDAFGTMTSDPFITNVYALSNGGDGFAPSTNSNTTNSGTRSDAELKNPNSYLEWNNFASIWEFKGGNYAFPSLKNNPHKGKGEL